MDSKRIMKEIARNRTVKYLFIVLCVITTFSHAEKTSFPSFSQFNRSISKGSEISYAIQYKGKPTDKLSEGLKSPYEDEWETHSTVTTGLFPVMTKMAKTSQKIVFMIRSEGREKVRSTLLASIRYFDEHGVLIGAFDDKKFEVPYQWTKVSLSLAPKKKATKYAEVWFIKFQDADSTGKVNHPVYLSSVAIE